MGFYYNPNNESFSRAVNSRIYVDKTGLLEDLNRVINTESNCISLSHARRFGKSQAARMIDAYYSIGTDAKELFSKFEIASKPDFEKYLNKYNVIHIDVSSFTDNYDGDVSARIWDAVYNEINVELPSLKDKKESVASILMDAYVKTGRSFVIIIDEWDCVIRNFSDEKMVHRYLEFLHSLFKSEESKSFLALAYITGILPVKKIKDESALNNFREFTMLKSQPITRFYGFTEDEVKQLCKKYDMDFETTRSWYNGYLIDGKHMYNPSSVVEALERHCFDSYWKNTSSFETVNTFITMNYDGLKDDVMAMLAGGKISVNPLTFQNDLSIIRSKDEALTALIHLGYLGYDADRKAAYIPNYEVATAFDAALQTGEWQDIAKAIGRCDELLFATIDGEADKVAEIVEFAHDTYTSVLKYNDENSLSCVLTMAYFTAPAYYNIVREMPTGKGFADFVFIPRANAGNKPAMVVELKYNKDAETAISQIKSRNYSGALSGYSDKILLVGINYSTEGKDRKHHTCVIEEWKNANAIKLYPSS